MGIHEHDSPGNLPEFDSASAVLRQNPNPTFTAIHTLPGLVRALAGLLRGGGGLV